MSTSYVERLRQTFAHNEQYFRHNAYRPGDRNKLEEGLSKLDDFFRDLEGIPWSINAKGYGEIEFVILDKYFHLNIICSKISYPTFSLHARIYNETIDHNEHVLETTESDTLISYLYILLCSAYPDKTKWVKMP